MKLNVDKLKSSQIPIGKNGLVTDNTRVPVKEKIQPIPLSLEQQQNFKLYGSLNKPEVKQTYLSQGRKLTPAEQQASNKKLAEQGKLQAYQKQQEQDAKNLEKVIAVAPYVIPGLGQAMWAGKAVDLAISGASDGKYKSWGDVVDQKTGSGEFIGDLTNPGYYAGAFPKLIGKGVQSIGKYALQKAEPYLMGGKSIPMSGYKYSNFKSEIDWKNWVNDKSDFKNNPDVIKHLYDIEKTSKNNGTWMKNGDGSNFNGTREQFVIQQSDNYKKTYPNENEITYRGVLKNNKNISEYGDNIDNTIFTANRELANRYGNRTDDPLRPLIKSENDKTGVYELYSKNSNNQLYLDALGDGWTSIDLSDITYKKSLLNQSIQQQKENLLRFLDNKKVYDIMQNRLTNDLDRFKRIDNIIDDRIKIIT